MEEAVSSNGITLRSSTGQPRVTWIHSFGSAWVHIGIWNGLQQPLTDPPGGFSGKSMTMPFRKIGQEIRYHFF